MPGPGNRPEAPRVYSQTSGPGMKPVYSGVGRDGQPTGLLGYEPDLSVGKVEVPKPPEILDLEKKLGTTLEPYYAQGSAPHGGQRDAGPPLGYRYDNGQSQYVNFDTSGQQTSIQDRNSGFNDLLKIAALAGGAYFLGPAIGELFGGAAAGGTAAGAAGGASALTPAAIESLVGTAGYGVNASALEAAAAANIPASAVGANALSEIPGAMTAPVASPVSTVTPLGDIANLSGSNVAALNPSADLAASGGGLTTGGGGAAGMGGGTGITGTLGTDLSAGGGLTGANTSLAAMGGGTGLTAIPSSAMGVGGALAAGGAALSNMGGGTGLTVPAAGGGTVGANGVNLPGITSGTIDTSALTNNPSLLRQLQDATGLTGTQLAALLSGGVNAATALNTSNAIGQGLRAQQDATKASQDVLKGVYNQQLGFQQPYQGAGVNAINQLGQLGTGQYQQYDASGQPTTMGTGSGYLTHQFDKNDLAAGLAPNYDFMLQQGQMANQRAANVGGGALSGNTLQGLQNYTQNYAGNAYQNAFQNYQTQRNNIYNNLSNMAGIGQTANQQAGQAGQAYGTGITGLNTGLANATAAAMLGQAQAAGGGANSLANSTFLASLLGQK